MNSVAGAAGTTNKDVEVEAANAGMARDVPAVVTSGSGADVTRTLNGFAAEEAGGGKTGFAGNGDPNEMAGAGAKGGTGGFTEATLPNDGSAPTVNGLGIEPPLNAKGAEDTAVLVVTSAA